jgi:hypothetical protein
MTYKQLQNAIVTMSGLQSGGYLSLLEYSGTLSWTIFHGVDDTSHKKVPKGFGKNNAYFPEKNPGREQNVRGARIWLAAPEFLQSGLCPTLLAGLPLVLPRGPATGGTGCAPQWRPTHALRGALACPQQCSSHYWRGWSCADATRTNPVANFDSIHSGIFL